MLFSTWSDPALLTPAKRLFENASLSPRMDFDPTKQRLYRSKSAPNSLMQHIDSQAFPFFRNAARKALESRGVWRDNLILAPQTSLMRYQSGDAIIKHDDRGVFYRDDIAYNSVYTLLYYVTPCEGGALHTEVHAPLPPEAGRCVLFDTRVSHWVTPVVSGTRDVIMQRVIIPNAEVETYIDSIEECAA